MQVLISLARFSVSRTNFSPKVDLEISLLTLLTPSFSLRPGAI